MWPLTPLCGTELFPPEERPVGARPALFSQRLQSLGQFKMRGVCLAPTPLSRWWCVKFSLRETDCARGSEVDVAPGALPVTQCFIVLNSPTAQHIIIGEQTVKLFHVAYKGYSLIRT